MNSDIKNKLESEFEETKKEIIAKVEEAKKLLKEADDLAGNKMNKSLSEVLPWFDIEAIQEVLNKHNSWNNSNYCWADSGCSF